MAAKLEHDVLGDGKGIIADLIVQLSLSAQLTELSDTRTQKLDVILQSGHQYAGRFAEAVSIILAGDARLPLVRAVYALAPELFAVILSTERFKVADARQALVCGIMDALSQQQLEAMAYRQPLLEGISTLTGVNHLITGMASNIDGWAWLSREPVRFNSLSAEVGDYVDLRKLDPKTVGLMSAARSVPIGDIAEMWEGLVEREEASQVTVVGKLALECARANAENFVMPRNCRSIIASRACDAILSQRERQELLHQALKLHVDWAITSSILASLTGGYAELLGDKRTVRLPNSELDFRLCQALNDRGFVGKIKPEKDYITAYTKRVGRL